MKAEGGRFSRKISLGRVKNFPLSADKKSAARECCSETSPASAKPDKENHGFGMLSIRYITEQYGGVCSVQQRQGNFELNILIPLENECA